MHFLLIGPMWLLAAIYRRGEARRRLDVDVAPVAGPENSPRSLVVSGVYTHCSLVAAPGSSVARAGDRGLWAAIPGRVRN
jgi:hypothetical protein